MREKTGHFGALPRHGRPRSDANRLGIAYEKTVGLLRYAGPIFDVHCHIHHPDAARVLLRIADRFGIGRMLCMAPLEQVDAIRALAGNRILFIAVPDYRNPDREQAFGRDWLHRLERFREKGVKICKFWAAPRGRDLSDHLRLDAPLRREAMKLARALGYKAFMSHVGDPDTWFATHYADHRRYGHKQSHFLPLQRMLDAYPDMPWIGAHMGGWPENPAFLQGMLDRHPNYVLDTSATRWMVREFSARPQMMRDFLMHNRGRILFGTDIVADPRDLRTDLFASRYFSMRLLMETHYQGPSPIDDPDLALCYPPDQRPEPQLHGLHLPVHDLHTLYHRAAERFLTRAGLLESAPAPTPDK